MCTQSSQSKTIQFSKTFSEIKRESRRDDVMGLIKQRRRG